MLNYYIPGPGKMTHLNSSPDCNHVHAVVSIIILPADQSKRKVDNNHNPA